MPLNILLSKAGKINNSNTNILIMLLTYSPNCNINGGVLFFIIPNNIHSFTLAVLIIYNYIAFNTSHLITYMVKVLSLS